MHTLQIILSNLRIKFSRFLQPILTLRQNKKVPDIKTTFSKKKKKKKKKQKKNKDLLLNLRSEKGYGSQSHIHVPTFLLSTRDVPTFVLSTP